MTDAAAPAGSVRAPQTAAQSAMEARLKKRHRAETWFKAQGLIAITIAMIFLVVLVGRIVGQGYTTFQTHTLSVPVYLNPERIDLTDLEGVNYDYIVAEAMMKKLGVVDDDLGLVSGKVMDLTSRDLGFQLGTAEPQSAIISVIMPDLERGAMMWEALLEEGLYVNLARPPATPAGMTLLRCSLCAEHSAEQVQTIIGMFDRAGHRAGILQG